MGRRIERWASKALLTAGVLAALGSAGCDENDEWVDLVPPAIPNGVYSITADGLVILRWNPNRESDLAGYVVWRDDDGDEEFAELAVIEADDPTYLQDGGTTDPADDYLEYFDREVVNGEYYSYAVMAFDRAGNESRLSYEYVLDVPRPENTDPNDPLVLNDRFVSPALSGYDFSSLSNQSQSFALVSTDFWFEIDGNGVPWLVVPPRVRIQDYGYVGFDVLTYAPSAGWSRSGRVEAIEGHSYALEIEAPGGGPVNYAKVEVLDLPPNRIEMFWGYQAVPGEPELKLPPSAELDPTPAGEEAGS